MSLRKPILRPRKPRCLGSHHRPRGHPGGAEEGSALPPPHFNTPAVAMLGLPTSRRATSSRSRSLTATRASPQHRDACRGPSELFAASGKARVPRAAGRRNLSREVKVTRDAEPLIEQTTAPIAFEWPGPVSWLRCSCLPTAGPNSVRLVLLGRATGSTLHAGYQAQGAPRATSPRSRRSPHPFPASSRCRRALPSGSACGRDRCQKWMTPPSALLNLLSGKVYGDGGVGPARSIVDELVDLGLRRGDAGGRFLKQLL